MGKGLRRRRSLVVAGLALALLVPAILFATQQRASASSTVLTIIDGSASVARGTADFTVAGDGDLVTAGDRVRTGDASHAVITFFDGSTIELEPQTTLQVQEAGTTGTGARSISVLQTLGRTWSSVQKITKVDSKFQLQTPTSTAVVRGTGFITEVLQTGETTLQTSDGVVEVSAQGQTVNVAAGQITTVQQNTAPTQPVPGPPPPNKLRFGMHSPALLAVVDPLGRACGLVLPGPIVVRQIPGCLATEPGIDPQLIDVPNAPGGTYSLVVFPKGNGGPYTLTAQASAGANLSFDFAQSGSIGNGEKQGSTIDVNAAADGTLTATGLSNISVLQKSTLKVVVPSASPAPTTTPSGTPDPVVFVPLPSPGGSAPASPTSTPTSTPTASPTGGPTASPTASPTGGPTSTPTATPTASPVGGPTLPPPPTATPTPTASPTVTYTLPPVYAPPPTYTTPTLAAVSVSAPSTATVGVPVAVTAVAKDGSGNTLTSYSGPCSYAASLPATPSTCGSFVAGLSTTSLTFSSPGIATVTVTTYGMSGSTGTITVSAPAPTLAAVSVTAPSTATVGVPVTVTAIAKDSGGNTITSYSGSCAYVASLAATPSTCTTFASGVSSTNLTFSAAGSTTVTVTTGGISGSSGAITVSAAAGATPPPGAHVILTATPSTLGNDGVSTSTIVAAYVDGTGNPVSAPSGISIALTSSNTTCCALTTSTAVIASGQSSSSILGTAGVVRATTTAGSATISGTASGGFSGPVTSTTVTVTNLDRVVLPAEVLAPPGGTATFTVTLTSPAPLGGTIVNLSTGNPAIGTVAASVTVPAGSTAASATVTGVVAGSTTLSGTATGYVGTTSVLTVKTITMSFSPSGSYVYVAATTSVTRQILLSNAAPLGGLTISLAAADATKATVTPSSVTIPAGQLLSPAFTISALVQASYSYPYPSTTITASRSGLIDAPLTVYVQQPPTLSLYSLDGEIGVGLYRNYAEVDLSIAAPAGGVSIALVNSNPTALSAPLTVTIPAGQSYVQFRIDGLAPGTATVTAMASGWVSHSSTIAVTPATFQFSGLSTSASSRRTGSAQNSFRVYACSTNGTCDYTASAVTVNYTVNSATAGIVTVTPTATIAVGGYVSTYAYVSQPTLMGTYTITASATGFTSLTTGTVTVTSSYISSVYGSTVYAGTYNPQGLTIYLSDPAPSGGLPVTLTSADTAIATVDATVTIPSGSSYYTVVRVDGIALGTTTVTAATTIPSWTGSTDTNNVTISQGGLGWDLVAYTRTTLSSPNTARIYLCNYPYYSACGNARAPSPVTVNFVVSSTPTGIVSVSPVTIAAGATYASVTIPTPSGPGTYSITASAAGFTDATVGAVTVTAPSVSMYSIGVAAGMHRNDLTLNLSAPAPTGGLVVNLASSDPTIATVPASVTVPQGSTSFNTRIDGIAVGSATITATPATTAWTGGTATATVNTAALQLSSISTSRTTLRAPETFYVSIYTGNCPYYYYACQFVNAPVTVDFAVTSTPAEILPVPASITVPLDGYQGLGTVGTPSGAGTYTVSASASGFTSVTSPPVTVTLPRITASTSLTLGAHMHTDLTLSFSDAVPTGGITVNLGSSDAGIASTTPAISLSVAGAATYATFRIDGQAPGAVNVTASALGWSPATITVTVSTAQLAFSGVTTSRHTFSASNNFSVYGICGGGCGSFNEGTTITFGLTAATPPTIVTVTPSYTVTGANESYAPGTISMPTATGGYTVTAAAAGFTSATSSTVTVTSSFLTLSSSTAPGLGAGMKRTSYYVSLSDPAPSGGLAVTFTSTDPTKATAASVTVAAGYTSGNFTLTGLAVGATNIVATATGWTSSAAMAVTVEMPTLDVQNLATTRPVGDPANTFYVYVRTSCGYCDTMTSPLSVTFIVSGATGVTVAPVTIGAGSDYAIASATSPTTAGTYTVMANAAGASSVTSGTITVTP